MTDNIYTMCATSFKDDPENVEFDRIINDCTAPRAQRLRKQDRRDRFVTIVAALLWAALALLGAILTSRAFLPVSTGAFICLVCTGMAVLNLRLLSAKKRGGKR